MSDCGICGATSRLDRRNDAWVTSPAPSWQESPESARTRRFGVPAPRTISPSIGAHTPPSPFGKPAATASLIEPVYAPVPVVPRKAPSVSAI